MRLAENVVTGLIRGYRIVISPLLPPTCRYHPSCSLYGLQAINRWGMVHGLWLTLCRLLRCHPLATGGLDPVPGRSDGTQQ